ncbi:MAG: hypothetical protein HKN58_11410 [Xanthomonadales bacterium]|nr:hypothetical protein [Xanthomonadales bacterium]
MAAFAMLFGASAIAELPGEGPRLGAERISQSEIESGQLTLRDIRLAGLKVFSTPFNKQDGFGDGPMNVLDPTSPGGRPTLQNNGTFLRVNGLDGQSCLECHSIVSNATVPATMGIGGVGGSVANAIFKPTFLDVGDVLEAGSASMDGRFINPPFLFGSGGIELLGREMTAELALLRETARANPGVWVPLNTKGVEFGELRYDGGAFDTSRLEGIDADLVVKPFGRKGEFATMRGFDETAMPFHFGMQPVEVFGEGVDADGDGVVNELTIGEMSALVVFNTTLPRPVAEPPGREAREGFELFQAIGCANCHKPSLQTSGRVLNYQFPESIEDPASNVYLSVDLSRAPAGFARSRSGGLDIPLFADLKRHDMGPELQESFGHELDHMFTTARLWGVADTAPYMHDGRALTLGEAILMHAGDAQAARDNFAGLLESERAMVLEFLLTLRTPRNPASDLAGASRRR